MLQGLGFFWTIGVLGVRCGAQTSWMQGELSESAVDVLAGPVHEVVPQATCFLRFIVGKESSDLQDSRVVAVLFRGALPTQNGTPRL